MNASRHMDRAGAVGGRAIPGSIRARLGVAALGLKTRTVPGHRGRRPPAQVFPSGIVQSYYSGLNQLLVLARELVEAELVPQLPTLTRLGASERGEPLRTDAAGDDVDQIMDRVARRYWDALGVNRLEQIGKRKARANLLEATADAAGRRLARFQKDQLDRQLRAILGVDLLTLAEPNISGQIQAFTKENVALIKSIPQAYFDQVEARVVAGVNRGDRPTSIAADLAERFGVAQSRAALVANDQVGKFYGKLNEVRQKHLGLNGYIWRTVSDDRVRLNHKAKDGRKYSWDDPPADTGHPGEDINCRCYAEPDVAGILEDLPAEAAPQRVREPEREQPVVRAPVPPPEPEPAATFDGPDGERYAREFPDLARIFGDTLHVAEADTTRDHLKDMQVIPTRILEKLAEGMNKITIGDGTLNQIKAEGIRRQSKKWDPITVGLYNARTKSMGVGSVGKEAGLHVGSSTHELGHAADFILGGTARKPWSMEPRWRQAWEDNIGNIAIKYARNSPIEGFAECWSELLRFGENRTRERFGNDLVDLMQAFLKEHDR